MRMSDADLWHDHIEAVSDLPYAEAAQAVVDDLGIADDATAEIVRERVRRILIEREFMGMGG